MLRISDAVLPIEIHELAVYSPLQMASNKEIVSM